AALRDKSDWQGLLGLSRQWAKGKANSALARVVLGEAYRHVGQYDKALEADQEAVRLDPQNPSRVNLGVDYSYLRRYDKTLEADQEAVRLDPQNALAWTNMGFAYCSLGRREKAIEVYQQLRQLDRDRAEKLFNACIVP